MRNHSADNVNHKRFFTLQASRYNVIKPTRAKRFLLNLEMLGAADALELAVDHDRQSRAQRLALLHAV